MPKVASSAAISPSSAPPSRSPSVSSAAPPPPPPAAAWEGGDGRRGPRYYPPQHAPAAQQHPHAYADPYMYSRGDPRGAMAGERRTAAAAAAAAAAPPVAAHNGGRGGAGGRGGGPRPAYPADDEADEDGVFPHYSGPASGRGRRGELRYAAGHGGAPPPAWSRQPPQHPHAHQQHQQQHPRHSSRGGIHPATADGHGQVSAPPRGVAGAAAGAPVDQAEGRGGRGSGRFRAVAVDDDYDHPFYQRERDPRGESGMVRGGRGGGRGPGGRMHYADAGPSMGPPGSASAASGHRSYPGPSPNDRDRGEGHAGDGGRSGGGGGGGVRSHPMAVGPAERGEPLPPRYMRPPAQSSINRALYEAVERIFQHRDKRSGIGPGGGRNGPGRDASPSVAGGAKMDAAGGADERGRASSTAMDAKQATMRIIAIMEGFDGRLDDVMADPRARAELDAIFPGVKDREFRALLESCIERSQVRPALCVHMRCVCVCLSLSLSPPFSLSLSRFANRMDTVSGFCLFFLMWRPLSTDGAHVQSSFAFLSSGTGKCWGSSRVEF